MVSQQLMPNIKYIDVRNLEPISNPFMQLRPSGKTRIVKGTLEYGLFQAALTYGFTFGGFGIHSYFFQVLDKSQKAPITRKRVFAQSFVKYGAIALAFHYAKEVYFGTIDEFTRDKPSFRKLINYSFVYNFLAGLTVMPLVYLLENRNPIKALRGSLAVCFFSMANDVFIEHRRKSLISQNFTQKELQEIFVKGRISEVKELISKDLQSTDLSQKEKQTLKNLNFVDIERQMMILSTPMDNDAIERQRKEQLQMVGQAIYYYLQKIKSIKKWFISQ